MRRKTIKTGTTVLLLALCLTGCGEPKSAKEARLKGIEQINAGNYSEAIESFDTAIKEADGVVNKFELDILKYRGEAEFALADYTAAKHTYEVLLDVDDEQPEYLYMRAASEAMSGEMETALADYESAAQADKSMNRNVYASGLALSSIGKGYAKNGDYEKATELYNKVIADGAATADVYDQMGLCMIQAKKYDEALNYFDQGLALSDEGAAKELSYNKAAAYEYKGDFKKALELFKAYAEQYGSTPELEKELAFLESR